jgi:hypothetical protein
LRQRLENSFAWHDYAHSRRQIAADLASPEERAALPAQCWRMVWRNPANGRGALYLASHTYSIEGMEQKAGNTLIDELMAGATAPGVSYLHRWRQGDVVMWDNRATMHRGRPWPAREPRLMIRTTISATDVDGLATMRPPTCQAAQYAPLGRSRVLLAGVLNRRRRVHRRRNLRCDQERHNDRWHADKPQNLIHRKHRFHPPRKKATSGAHSVRPLSGPLIAGQKLVGIGRPGNGEQRKN